MTTHLRYDMNTAFDRGEKRHSETVMRSLGISYHHSEPVTIADCWLFYGCSNVPEALPEYLTSFEVQRVELPHFAVRCPVCNWHGSSKDAAGGASIADTGDFDDIVCPKCVVPDATGERWWIQVKEVTP